jgi:hypothetical protein
MAAPNVLYMLCMWMWTYGRARALPHQFNAHHDPLCLAHNTSANALNASPFKHKPYGLKRGEPYFSMHMCNLKPMRARVHVLALYITLVHLFCDFSSPRMWRRTKSKGTDKFESEQNILWHTPRYGLIARDLSIAVLIWWLLAWRWASEGNKRNQVTLFAQMHDHRTRNTRTCMLALYSLAQYISERCGKVWWRKMRTMLSIWRWCST